jgi:hypothetical protein
MLVYYSRTGAKAMLRQNLVLHSTETNEPCFVNNHSNDAALDTSCYFTTQAYRASKQLVRRSTLRLRAHLVS